MSIPNLPGNEQLLTYEERVNARKKIIKSVFKKHVGIPIIGTIILIILVTLFYTFFPENNENKRFEFIGTFLIYAISFSLLWLIGGLFNYIRFKANFPPIKK